ncbi:lytic transglycosylase domain-containing protein [Acuticoccus kandeliae]|uniref:lytic transglycosylase domain-containing protein n=1 Tax=Acuticoccus kandeliae TaxID=2073160 RepID=UPI001B3B9C2B
MAITILAALILAQIAGPAAANESDSCENNGAGCEADPDAPAEVQVEAPKDERKEVAALCRLMMSAAARHDVPADFFIRLIWKESRFNPGAVSPVGAQGIAQFMPGTARIRGLKDPFDPEQALDASASFLADLRRRFGSWGLAAAGYNGGPNRVPPFVAGIGGLPYETIDYVFSITGRSADYWAGRAQTAAARAADGIADTAARFALDDGTPDFAPRLPIEPHPPGAADFALALSASPVRPWTETGRIVTGMALAVAAAERSAEAAQTEETDKAEGEVRPALADTGMVARLLIAAMHPRAMIDSLADGVVAPARSALLVPLPPRPRPDYRPMRVDCPELVARLGRTRAVAPPAGTSTAWTPWGAQVAGHTQRAIAMRQYARLKSRLPGDLVEKGPTVIVRRFAARGRRPIHAVQFAAGSRAEAAALCRRITQALSPCVVVKNG